DLSSSPVKTAEHLTLRAQENGSSPSTLLPLWASFQTADWSGMRRSIKATTTETSTTPTTRS
ncbi:hypothetical protein RvY_16591, partial [Ramazzottius varieornatus]